MYLTYRERIKDLAPDYDPRHVEAYMRSAHSTLDHLSPAEFSREVRLAVACIETAGKVFAERVAKSFGF